MGKGKILTCIVLLIFSSPGRRAIVLPPASALASAAASALAKCYSITLKFLCDGQGDVRRAILSL